MALIPIDRALSNFALPPGAQGLRDAIPSLATTRKVVKGYLLQPKFPVPVFPFQYNPNQISDRKTPQYAQIQIPGLPYPRYAYSYSGPRIIEFSLFMYGYEEPATIDRLTRDFVINGVSTANLLTTAVSAFTAAKQLAKVYSFTSTSFTEAVAIQTLAPGLIPALTWLYKLRQPIDSEDNSNITARVLDGIPTEQVRQGLKSNFQFSAPPLVLFSFGAMSFLGGAKTLGLIPCVVKDVQFSYDMFNRQLAPVKAEVKIVLEELEQDEYTFFRGKGLI